MNKKNRAFAGIMLGFFSTACMAQGEDPAQAYVYSTYHICDVATQEQMDEVIEQYDKPVLDKAVVDGRMTAWGYYAHMTGGPWRRLQYHIAPTLEAVLENQQTIFAEIYQDNPAAGQARSAACARHDDYIWALLDGSGDGGDGDPPAVSLSVYYVCDYTREEEADEIIAETFAPVLNQLVEDDKLAAWSWLAHRVGGKYRRLHTMTGTSHAAVLAARAEVLQATGGQAGGGFGDICGSHTDYLWDIVHLALQKSGKDYYRGASTEAPLFADRGWSSRRQYRATLRSNRTQSPAAANSGCLTTGLDPLIKSGFAGQRNGATSLPAHAIKRARSTGIFHGTGKMAPTPAEHGSPMTRRTAIDAT